MKKQKMTADNVEQLMEIVRALQTGQDPAEALEKKKAEAAREEEAVRQEQERRLQEEREAREARKAAVPRKSLLRGLFRKSSEDTEEVSEEVPAEAPDQEAAAITENAAERDTSEKNASNKNASNQVDSNRTDVNKADSGQKDAPEKRSAEVHTQNDAGSAKKVYVPGQLSGVVYRADENTEVRKKEALHEETHQVSELDAKNRQMDEADLERVWQDTEDDVPRRRPGRLSKQSESIHRSEQFRPRKSEYAESAQQIQTERSRVNSALDRVSDSLWRLVRTIDLVLEPLTGWQPKFLKEEGAESESRKAAAAQVLESEEMSGRNADQKRKARSDAEAETVQSAEAMESEQERPGDLLPEGEQNVKRAASEEESKETESEEAEAEEMTAEETTADLEEETPLKTPETSGRLFEKLAEKGIYRKEIVMLAAAVVFVAAAAFFAVNGIQNYKEQKRKSAHVAAEKGLTVTVEQEPEQWCSEAEIQLRFRTPRVPVTRVTINGTTFQPDAKGYIDLITSEHILEAEAETENGTLHATIEIPKLDAQAPVVYASKAQNQITLLGTDSRSSIKVIRYAVLHDTDLLRLPAYQDYTGTIPYEEGAVYYFYAMDAAGNKSVPIVTNMETAESISLGDETLSMYPDETADLNLEVMPSGALLNNLKYESMNPDILSVDANGTVTALKEGTAAVKVSADGVESVICTVEISRTRTVTISAIGDCTLGTDASFNTTTNLNAFAAMNGNDYFFKNVKAILDNDDATFANLECVLTTENSRAAKTYAFKGDPSFTEILTEGSVEVVTLANNHSNDYGDKSYEDTVNYLKEAGIAYCDGDEIAIRDINGVKTAFVGIYVLRDGAAKEEQVRTTIAAAKEAGAELVITAFHWGSEKSTKPDDTQKLLAHTAVDCGADLVVGHHPHVLQGIELYNGTYIAYSLANFCFGGNTAPSDKDTMIFRQTFTFIDGVLQEDAKIEIVPCSVSSVYEYNNYQPTPAVDEEVDRIMGRINEYSQEFGQTYRASDGLA